MWTLDPVDSTTPAGSDRLTNAGINSIELTPWWYLFALIGPLLSVVITILVPRSNWIWKGPLLCNVLIVLMLVSFAHIPAMYIAGGFR